MALDLTFVMYGSLCCPSFYVIDLASIIYWSCIAWISMSPGLASVMHRSLYCLSFYVAWSHFRDAYVLVLSEFLCHLVSVPLYMGPCVFWVSMSLDLTSIIYWTCIAWVSMSLDLTSIIYWICIAWVSMSLGLTFVMYRSLCCLSFYVTWSHFRSVWVSMLSEFLCQLISLPLCMGPCVSCVSMSFGLTFGMHRSLCCLNFYVTWSRFHYTCIYGSCVVWISMSLGLASVTYGSCVVRVSISLDLTSVLYRSLCCPCFYVTLSHFHSVCVLVLSLFAILVLFYLYVRDCVTIYRRYNFFRKISSKWRT